MLFGCDCFIQMSAGTLLYFLYAHIFFSSHCNFPLNIFLSIFILIFVLCVIGVDAAYNK